MRLSLTRAAAALPGIQLALSRIGLPVYVASNGDQDKMRTSLGLTGLLDHFGDRLLSPKATTSCEEIPGQYACNAEALLAPAAATSA